MKKIFNLRGGRKLTLGEKTLVMGILNVTPDSFSDGGKFIAPEAAINHAAQLISDGADILDLGAESTRPNAKPISADEEFSRLEKVLPALMNLGVPISIDTYKPEVAAQALEFGADIINDTCGLENLRMINVVKKFSAPVIAVHNERCCECGIVCDVKKFFRRTIANCAACEFDATQIIFDPGIGFGKTFDDDLELLRRLDELKTLDGEEIPVMFGVSRKRIVGSLTGLEVGERDAATGALCLHAIERGIDIVRVHNVKMISPICRMTDKLSKEK